MTQSRRKPGKRYPPENVETPTNRTAPAPPRKSAADRVAAVAHKLPPAQPGSRVKSKVPSETDNTVTSRIERISVEHTPAPLPPSPAADAADTWFEQVPTSPAAVPDLGALTGSRPDLKSGLLRTKTPPRQSPPHEDAAEDIGAEPWPLYPEDYSGPLAPPATGSPWVLPVLLAATCLAVGMVLGALLFGGATKATSGGTDAGVCECPKCPEPDE